MRWMVLAALLLFGTPAFAGSAPPASGATGAPATVPRKIDVNRASVAELVGVPGIGERLAEAIVELREKRGPFTRLDDLLEVRGIGEKNLVRLSDHLMVAQAPATPSGGESAASK